MGETMRSFHSMIELQSLSMQAIQKQMELTRVPPPPPPPPDYVGLGKTLLEILRDLGMKAMDSGYVRRQLPPRGNQELPEIRYAEMSQPAQRIPVEEAPSSAAPQAAGDSGTPHGNEELRRILTRMGEVDVARAFSSPENFRDMLADIRREIDGSREQATEEMAPAVSEMAPAVSSIKAAASAPSKTTGAASAKVPPPSGKTSPPASAKGPPASNQTPPPASSQTSLLPSGQTPRAPSTQTPQRKPAETRHESWPRQGQKRP
jgi:hypothetical protein